MEGMAMFDVLLTGVSLELPITRRSRSAIAGADAGDLLAGDTVMALDQAKHLLSLMKHRKDRVAFASQVRFPIALCTHAAISGAIMACCAARSTPSSSSS
eukprot:428232-Rhodomonas_salina.6